MIFGGATSVIVNANPLIPLDGYFALSDYLEVPNLRQRAFAHLGWLVKTKLLGWTSPRRRRMSGSNGSSSSTVPWRRGTPASIMLRLRGDHLRLARPGARRAWRPPLRSGSLVHAQGNDPGVRLGRDAGRRGGRSPRLRGQTGETHRPGRRGHRPARRDRSVADHGRPAASPRRRRSRSRWSPPRTGWWTGCSSVRAPGSGRHAAGRDPQPVARASGGRLPAHRGLACRPRGAGTGPGARETRSGGWKPSGWPRPPG